MSVVLKNIDLALDYLNKNKYFTGIMMVLLNIGAYVSLDLTKAQNAFLSSVWIAVFLFLPSFLSLPVI